MLAQDHLSHRAQSSGVSYYWQLVAAKHPTVHGAALQQQNCLAPNVNNPVIKKLFYAFSTQIVDRGPGVLLCNLWANVFLEQVSSKIQDPFRNIKQT